MKNIKNLILLCLAVSIAAACSDSANQIAYSEPASIYLDNIQWGGNFGSTSNISTMDSLAFSFFGTADNFTEAIGELRFLVSGYMSDKDRVVNLVADPESTLTPDDYVLPDPIVVPAGELKLVLPIRFKRSDKLRDEYYWVKFNVEDSDDLKKGYYDKLSFRFFIIDQPVPPSQWPSSFFGTYSVAKHRFILQVIPDIEWSTSNYPANMAYQAKLKQAIAIYERDNGPLYGRAEDGEENVRVTF